jgi:hypothetical protein
MLEEHCKKNGNKNGWVSTDPTTQDGRNEILDHGINYMGMVNIPVCSIEEGLKNAWPGVKSTISHAISRLGIGIVY